MTIFWFLTCVFSILFGCKELTSTLKENDSRQGEIALAVQSDIDPAFQQLFSAIVSGKSLTLSQLDAAGVAGNNAISQEVAFSQHAPGSSSRIRSRDRSNHGFNTQAYKDIYRGVPIAGQVFVFKLENQDPFKRTDSWELFTWFGASILNDQINGKFTSITDQVRYVLETKIYEPDRIAHRQKLVEDIDFVAHFLPGYAGANSAFYGDTTSQRVVGVLQMAGDVFTFGLGSKISIVKKGAVAIVGTAASARVAIAGGKLLNGTATGTDGVDAFIATVEGVLATVTVVKLRIRADKAVVSNIDEAKILSGSLNRSADDIIENAITRNELERFGVDVSELMPGGVRGVSSSGGIKVLPDLKFTKGRTSIRNALGPGDHVVIARSESGHFEINVAGTRVHAFGPLQPLTSSRNATLPQGAWVVFRDLPPDLLAKLKSSAQHFNKMPTLGCANGVCKILKQSGINVGSGGYGSGILTSTTLQDIVQNGFAHGGRKLDIELFSTRKVSIDELVVSAKRVDRKYVVTLVLAVPVGIQLENGIGELFAVFEEATD